MLLSASLSLFCKAGYAQESMSADGAKRSLASISPAPKTVSNQKSYGRSQVNSHKPGKATYAALAKKGYPRTHLDTGLYLKEKGDSNGALSEFLLATQENPRLVKGFYEQALIFREKGSRKQAESALEQALEVKPDYTEARILLATVQLEQGNLGGAVQELSKSLGLSNDQSDKHDKVDSKANSPQQRDESSKTESKPADNGLLSSALPAILQSVHGLLQPALDAVSGRPQATTTAPPAKLGGLNGQSADTSVSNAPSAKVDASDKGKDDSAQVAETATSHAKQKRKERSQKSKEKTDRESAQDVLAMLSASSKAESAALPADSSTANS